METVVGLLFSLSKKAKFKDLETSRKLSSVLFADHSLTVVLDNILLLAATRKDGASGCYASWLILVGNGGLWRGQGAFCAA